MSRTPNAGATGTGTLAPVAASATVVTLFANSLTIKMRRAVFNDGNVALYIKYGTGASLTDWSVKVLAGGYFEFPLPLWGGPVTGIWDAAPTGNARLTEY